MICRKCGKVLDESKNFCTRCGTPLVRKDSDAGIKSDLENRDSEKENSTDETNQILEETNLENKEKTSLKDEKIDQNGEDEGNQREDKERANEKNLQKKEALITKESGELSGFQKLRRKKSFLPLAISFGVIVLVVLLFFVVTPLIQDQIRNVRYQDAISKMDDGSYEEAEKLFIELEDYKDSQDLALDCRNSVDYDIGIELKNSGNYLEAKKIFKELGTFKDARELTKECNDNINYDKGKAAYDAGEFYTAYSYLTSASDFKDANQLAETCRQPYPGINEIYRNPSFGGGVGLIIQTNPSNPQPSYIKVYTEDNTLVSCVFINSGGRAGISLPGGNYRIKVATGEDWYGEKEMFGDEGSYSVLLFDNGNEIASLNSAGDYELVLGGVQGGNVGSQHEDMDHF
ncbi:MAG: zinc-ribbon domain-containing protein [Eubacteriaceae bacterium]